MAMLWVLLNNTLHLVEFGCDSPVPPVRYRPVLLYIRLLAMLRFAVGVRTCVVSFGGERGVRHAVEVTASSLYEAAALALSVFKQSEWADAIGPGTELVVAVRNPETTHRVTLNQLRRWCDGVAVSPDEVLKRQRVKALIG